MVKISKTHHVTKNGVIKKNPQYVKAVMKGLLVESEEHKQQIYEGFKEMGFHKPIIYGSFKTLAGHGGEGGRSDVVVGFHDKDIGRLAVHPMHLSGDFSWADDYVANNHDLIPPAALRKYFDEDDMSYHNQNQENEEDEEY